MGATKRPFRRFGDSHLPPPVLRPGVGDARRAPTSPPVSVEEKFHALRTSHRAQELCVRCGAKWSRDHRCSEMVQLSLVQDLLDIFPDVDAIEEEGPSSPTSSQIMLHLSVAALAGAPAPKTLCLTGILQGKSVSILVDSGSSHTFINSAVAQSLSGVQPLSPAVHVQVANGAVLQCTSHIPSADWSIQGYHFSTNLKLLPLSSYDMILGLDWLASFSPMQVHWDQKWISIPYEGSAAVLLGDIPSLPAGSVLQLCLIQADTPELPATTLPPAVQSLVTEFASLFVPLSGLPPSRHCDHAIPLIPGAQPVFVRPYHYAPLLKNEIERQVSDMLQQGLIQKSTSAFASPVLLVKKKDQSWRFCVDYRQLNAITVKGKYPAPIIEELLDELSGAAYFSTLDLQSGFHQIRMQSGEEYKIAFQTHFGQFKFWVMSFGLTGAPGSFQDAMNTTLSTCLRKFVLVFFDDILIYSRTLEDHISYLRCVFELLSRDQWKQDVQVLVCADCNFLFGSHNQCCGCWHRPSQADIN